MVQAKTALPVKLHIRFRRIRSRSSPRRRASCSSWSISPRHTSIGARRLVPATVVETYHYPAS